MSKHDAGPLVPSIGLFKGSLQVWCNVGFARNCPHRIEASHFQIMSANLTMYQKCFKQ